MKQLTLKDKKTLMGMLQKHYSIDESAFIKAIAQNEEEEVELTLKAFSLTQRIKEDNFEFKTVQIEYVDGKLTLIKAIKETTHLGLAECKAIGDQIVSFTTGGGYVFTPFKVGVNNKLYTFTVNQWIDICTYLHNNYGVNSIKWHYV